MHGYVPIAVKQQSDDAQRSSISVGLLIRKPLSSHYSYERLYERLIPALPLDISARLVKSRFTSSGLVRRIYIILEAAFRRADVIHVTGDAHFLTYLLRRNRTVLTIHDVISAQRLTGVRRRLFLLLWYRIPMARARVITVVSDATRNRLAELGLAKGHDIRVIPNFTFSEFSAVPKDFHTECPTILVVGTATHKNLDRIAQALAGIRCRLRIIGRLSEPQRAHLESNRISYTNEARVSDEQLVEEYRRCDMLLFVSLEEGFGLPILEAQATGRSVVTSNISSMPEVAGAGAEYVDPLDVASIRSGVERVIHDGHRREQLVAEGFKNLKRFAVTEVAEQYARIYRELAGPSA